MNKFLLLLTFPLLALCFGSCSKDAIYHPSFTLDINNTEDNPYKVEIDGRYVATIQPDRGYTIEDEPGYYQIIVTQVSGYLLYPTVFDLSNTFRDGDNKFFVIDD